MIDFSPSREYWTIVEDGILIAAYDGGVGWEERASAALEDRTPGECERRGKYLHLRSSDWMAAEMRRQGMTLSTFKTGAIRSQAAARDAARRDIRRSGL